MEEYRYSYLLHATETGISSNLMRHLVCMQTLCLLPYLWLSHNLQKIDILLLTTVSDLFSSIRVTLNVQLTGEEIKCGAQVIKQAAESIFG